MNESLEQYKEQVRVNNQKLVDGQLTYQQWQDLCCLMLAEILKLNENK